MGHYHLRSPKAAIPGIILTFWSSERACDHVKSKVAPGCSFAACEPRPLGCHVLLDLGWSHGLEWGTSLGPCWWQGKQVAVCSIPCFPQGLHFHKRRNLPDWLSSHFPQPHTLPRLGPMSYIWRLGNEQGQQTCICPCWVCLQVGKTKWTDSFFICSVYDHFRGFTLEWQVFGIRKYWENWQDDSFFKMALNTGINRTHP